MDTKSEYPKTITGDKAVSFAESTHIGSGDGIPVGNLALLAAISIQYNDTTELDVSVAIYNAYN